MAWRIRNDKGKILLRYVCKGTTSTRKYDLGSAPTHSLGLLPKVLSAEESKTKLSLPFNTEKMDLKGKQPQMRGSAVSACVWASGLGCSTSG